jgi:hypothetical protein
VKKSKKLKIFLMSGISFILLVFILLPILGHAWRKRHPFDFPSVVPASHWKFYASDGGGFRVLFPGVPEYTNVIVSASGVDISQPCFFVWADRQTEYTVNYGDYPKSLKKLKPEKQFDIYQSGVADAIGKIVYQKDAKFEDYPARDFEFVAGGKANYSGRVRLILVDERLFQLMIIFLTKNPHQNDFKIFFDSFAVTKNKTNNLSQVLTN